MDFIRYKGKCKFKRDSTLEEYEDFTNGYNPNPLSWLAEIFELKKGTYLSWLPGKGVDIHCSAQNAALFVDLL